MSTCHLRFTLALALCILAIGCDEREETITINGETFTLELALDEAAREMGMSHRESFPDGGAMLFVFPDAQTRIFWMYECLMDIDLAFLDRHGNVVALHRMPMEPPRQEDESQWEYENRLPRYSSRSPAQFALEFPAGTLDRLGMRVDERINLDTQRLKAMAE